MLDLTLSFGWFGFFLTQTYCVFYLSKQHHIRKLPGHIPRSGVLTAYLPDPVGQFLTHTSFLSLHFLFLLSHPVDPIMFCGSFQKRVWNGTLFASPKKSKEMEKVQLHCNFLVVQRLIVIQWPDILFPGKRGKKPPYWNMTMFHQPITKVQSAASLWLLQSPFFFFLFPGWANVASFLFIAVIDLLLHLDISLASVLMPPVRWLLRTEHSNPTKGE